MLGIEKGLTENFYDFDFVMRIACGSSACVYNCDCPGPVLSQLHFKFITPIAYSRDSVKLYNHFVFYSIIRAF